MDKQYLGICFISLIFMSGSVFCKGQKSSDASITSGSRELMHVVEANRHFALDLYKRYSAGENNVFFSPYSISSALAMTCEGAGGKTAEEIKKVFYFPQDESMREGYLCLYKDINRKDKKYKLSTANALWAQDDYSFLGKYFGVVEKYYGGSVKNMDFTSRPEPSRMEINSWVEKETGGKIKDLIPPGSIDSLTRLVLTNAVYFKGEWVKQFDSKKTEEKDFTVSENKTVKVLMMQRTGKDARFHYAEDSIAQVLEMPYSGEDLSMLVLLPKNRDMKRLENSLSPEKLRAWKNSLENRRVEVFFPKFKFGTKYFMAEDLAAMGMPEAFTGNADFSGMTGRKDLCISQVIHQAFVEVNEEGTEAAAATGVVMKLTAMPSGKENVPVFRADRPFVFIIQQKKNGNILFIGKVNNPLLS